MLDTSKFDFHESTIVEFQKHSNTIKMVFEQVSYDNHPLERVTLILNNVSSVDTDAKKNQPDLMAAEDGEILFLDLEEHTCEFVIEWNDFLHKLRFHHKYIINFSNFSIVIK